VPCSGDGAVSERRVLSVPCSGDGVVSVKDVYCLCRVAVMELCL